MTQNEARRVYYTTLRIRTTFNSLRLAQFNSSGVLTSIQHLRTMLSWFTHQVGILLSIPRSQEYISTNHPYNSNIDLLDNTHRMRTDWFEPSVVHRSCGHELSYSWEQGLADYFLPSGESGRRNIEYHTDEGNKMQHVNHRWNNVLRSYDMCEGFPEDIIQPVFVVALI